MKCVWMSYCVLLSLSGLGVAQAASFRVVGVRGQVLLEREFSASRESLGAASNGVFEQALARHEIPQYQGSESGVLSVSGLGSAMEVLSDTRMNAYGWCYRVDGKSSDLMADQYRLTGAESLIEWFYAYARLDKTDWTAMCVPADHEPVQGE